MRAISLKTTKYFLFLLGMVLSGCMQYVEPVELTPSVVKIDRPVAVTEVVAAQQPARPKVVKKRDPYADEIVVMGLGDDTLGAVPLDDPLAETDTDSMCLPIIKSRAVNGVGREKYLALLQKSISRSWIKPLNVGKAYQCDVRLNMANSGCIKRVNVHGCEDNSQLVRSIEMAIYRAAPYPKFELDEAGSELVFQFFAGP